MWSLIVTAVIGAIKAIFGMSKPKEASATDLAASNAAAQTQLHEEQAANVVVTQASAVRANADLSVVRSITEAGPDVDAAANARLKQQFPGQFRD